MASKLRVYIAIGTFHPLIGGAEKQALAQCRSVRERGYEATVVTFRHHRQWPRHERVEGVPVIRIAGLLLGDREQLPRILQRALYMLALAMMGWVLWRQRRHYDIVHVHQFTLLAVPAALASWLAHKPMIVVMHSAGRGRREKSPPTLALAAGPLDSTLPQLHIDALPLAGGDLANLELLGKLGMRFSRTLLQHIGAVPVIISSRMKSYLAEYDFNLPGIQVIPNGVDIARFQPTNAVSSREERARTVICVCRLSYEKGIDVLLQAWCLVQQQAPDLRAQLIIVGGGPLEVQLKWMAQALGITDSVIFAGMQSDIPLQLHRGALAVLPSRWEGMPVAVLEAMACGLPCVATRVSGSEDIIQHGINGLIVEPEDGPGLARAIVDLLEDPLSLKNYGRAARATIEERYTLEHISSTYLELYHHLVQRGSRKYSSAADFSAAIIEKG
ncbi:MAG: glycosyltransferase family 4 protein [Chloroflexota bacterium]|nr:glycosyltransferase family 4 protein [Chloroflexota bacterium]